MPSKKAILLLVVILIASVAAVVYWRAAHHPDLEGKIAACVSEAEWREIEKAKKTGNYAVDASKLAQNKNAWLVKDGKKWTFTAASAAKYVKERPIMLSDLVLFTDCSIMRVIPDGGELP